MKITAKGFHELTAKELYELLKSRSEIFVIEQKIQYQDMDDIDYDSLHCFFMEDSRVTAYLRAFYPGDSKDVVKLGRVLTLRHGNGLGKELMRQSIDEIKAKMGCKKIVIDSQKYAAGFYEKFGFVKTTGDFLEEGIVHVGMELNL